ncbi:MAG TPA: hypothetical protein VJS45_16445 [Acidimicrobiia bacterium]|nr:hypothetical protein [Acidimicrobiia bacterium]
MRRVALYGIGWVAAAAVAVLLAWQGVGLVGRNVTDSHPRALTADEARQALGDGSAAGVGSPDTGPATTSPTGTGGSPAGSSSTTTSSAAARPRPTATTATTTAATTGPAIPDPTPPSTAGGTVRTYNLVGGSTAVRFDPSGAVTVVWANPNPGFRVDVDDRDGGGVRVRFDGDSGRSQVEAWWDGGPQDRVEEQGGDGGSGRG